MKIVILLGAIFGLTACADDRHAQELPQPYIASWTHLSVADRQQIVQLVSRKTRQPIQGIVRWKPDSQQIAVFTGFTDADIYVNPWREYQLEKRLNGWEIVGQDIISPGIAGMLMTYPPNDTHRRKKT